MKTKSILYAGLLLAAFTVNTACEDMLSVDSGMVEFDEDHKQDSPTDTLYSVMGIIGELQKIADRTVLLGELRGDLVQVNENASTDLRELADFTVGTENSYNSPHDYYSVINNCNYFLANVDTALTRRNEKVFEKEYAAVKTYRAWTYLQLAQVYGRVPFVTTPITTEQQADLSLYPEYDIQQICDYFISDLVDYIDVPLPQYGSMASMDSRQFFLPTRLVLGDLCLWGGRYRDAAQYYHDYLNMLNSPKPLFTSYYMSWAGAIAGGGAMDYFYAPSGTYTGLFPTLSTETFSFIPMEASIFDGVVSDLPNIYNSTSDNDYFYQVEPAQGLVSISQAQSYCYVFTVDASTGKRDTLYSPRERTDNALYIGDLRLAGVYKQRKENSSNTEISAMRQTVAKFQTTNESCRVVLYRKGQIYLRYAEALNRAGFPESAFAVLKYGLCSTNVEKYISTKERERAGGLINFDIYNFLEDEIMGVHGRGCGTAPADTTFVLPMPETALASYEDTVSYQQPLVEDIILNEMALETFFEGNRFGDLMRVALRRGDNSYLADKVAKRNADSEALRSVLMERNNWYLPLK